MYDFNRITGLDENKLNSYNSDQLKNATDRVKTMIEYGTWTEKLNQFFMNLQAKYWQALENEKSKVAEKKMVEDAEQSYSETQAIKTIEEMMSKK
jgi:hypothetical protein